MLLLRAVAGLLSQFNQECIAPSFKLFAFCDVTSLIGKPFIRINANQEKAAASTKRGSYPSSLVEKKVLLGSDYLRASIKAKL